MAGTRWNTPLPRLFKNDPRVEPTRLHSCVIGGSKGLRSWSNPVRMQGATKSNPIMAWTSPLAMSLGAQTLWSSSSTPVSHGDSLLVSAAAMISRTQTVINCIAHSRIVASESFRKLTKTWECVVTSPTFSSCSHRTAIAGVGWLNSAALASSTRSVVTRITARQAYLTTGSLSWAACLAKQPCTLCMRRTYLSASQVCAARHNRTCTARVPFRDSGQQQSCPVQSYAVPYSAPNSSYVTAKRCLHCWLCRHPDATASKLKPATGRCGEG